MNLCRAPVRPNQQQGKAFKGTQNGGGGEGDEEVGGGEGVHGEDGGDAAGAGAEEVGGVVAGDAAGGVHEDDADEGVVSGQWTVDSGQLADGRDFRFQDLRFQR